VALAFALEPKFDRRSGEAAGYRPLNSSTLICVNIRISVSLPLAFVRRKLFSAKLSFKEIVFRYLPQEPLVLLLLYHQTNLLFISKFVAYKVIIS